MNGVKKACVYIEDILQWVPLTQVDIFQRFLYEGKNCAEFSYEGKILTSYIEYHEV